MLGTGNNSMLNKMRQQELATATPESLIVKLLQRLILDLTRAKSALENPGTGIASTHIVHAQAIISELDQTLDDRLWDGARDLHAVYSYSLETLTAANQNSDPALVQTAITLLTPIVAAFEEAAKTPAGS